MEPLSLAAMAAAFISASMITYVIAASRPTSEIVVGAGGPERPAEEGPLMALVLRIARAFAPLHKDMDRSNYGRDLQKKLIRAGKPFSLTPAEFMGLRYVGLGVGFVIGYALSVQAAGEAELTYILPVGLFGFFYPAMRLTAVMQRRMNHIIRDLPYVLDLLVLSTEAGMDFTSAMGMVVENAPAGPLVNEFRIAQQEVILGKSRGEALRAMAARVDLPELTSFVLALLQAEQLGTSIARVLRIMADQMRIKRSTLVEEMAGKVPVKLMAPLVALIFPASFIVLFVPIYIRAQLTGGI